MRINRLAFILPLVMVFIISCNKDAVVTQDNQDSETAVKGMEALTVSKAFNWQTTKTLDVNIVLPEDEELKPIRIVSSARNRVFFQGYPENGDGVINTRVTVPAYIQDVELQIQHGSVYQPVLLNLDGMRLDYDFNSSLKNAVLKVNNNCETIDFNEDGQGNPLAAGTVLTNQWANKGISISAHNNNNSHPDKAIIFDSSNPTGNDDDLGTPNQDFGGPGIGSGGSSGQPGQNSLSLGNLIIIATDDVDNNNDGFVDDPDDEAAGGKIFFDFDDPVEIQNIEFVDMDDGSLSSKVICKKSNGTEVEFTIPYLGNNSYKKLSVFITDVVKLTIKFKGSGSVASIGYCPTPPEEDIVGNLSYEDLWPGKGDFDFNDVVIDYNFEVQKDNQDRIEKINATFITRAYGASFHNGFGFIFPNVDPSDIISVSGYDIQTGSIFNLSANGTEAGQSKATFIVFDDTYNIMTHPGQGIGVNTETAMPFVTPDTIRMEIVFVPNAVTYSQLDIGNFNPFIIVDQKREHEVHLPDMPLSDLGDPSYFGTFDDDSDPGSGRYYKTENNLPWAIHIPESFEYPIEKQDITGAYLKFADWAESGGTLFPDWYKDLPGYRVSSLIY